MDIDYILGYMHTNGYYSIDSSSSDEERCLINEAVGYRLVYFDGKKYKLDDLGRKLISDNLKYSDYKGLLGREREIDKKLKISTISSNVSTPRIALGGLITSIVSVAIAANAMLMNMRVSERTQVMALLMSNRIDSLKKEIAILKDSIHDVNSRNKTKDSISIKD